MDRTRKSILMIIIAVILAGGMVFTMHSAVSAGPDAPQMPPQMQMDQNGNQDSNSSDSNQPPAPPDQNGNSAAPDQNGSSASGDQNGNSASGGQNSNSSSETPNGTPPSGAPSGNPPEQGQPFASISTPYYILFGLEGLALGIILLYLIMSGMNRKTFGETFDQRKKTAAFIVAALLIGAALIPAQAAIAEHAFARNGQPPTQQQMPGSEQTQTVEASGATTVDGTEETLNDTYTSTNADENAILVTNGGSLISDGATIDKQSGDSSNTGSSDFSGVNAGLLVTEQSTATVKNAKINTSAKGANAVFATGENAKITISDSVINTTGEASSRGLDATYGGTITADNVSITTQGGSCAAMATDRGEGTVSASNSELETNGAGSPLIYSTGSITLTDSRGTANGAQITVVEGKNSAVIENSDVTCSGAGNRGDVDIAGVMVYQSMSGDAGEGTGSFTASNSTLSISEDSDYYKTAPMFFVTNTDAVIDLTNTELNFGSGVLLSAKGTGEWGTEGSNGGNVTLNAEDQKLTGDIALDKLSTLEMKLTGSSYKGTINGSNEAGQISLTLDKDSKITLTGDSYITALDNADADYSNIDFNGHTLYVNGKAVN